jgi:ADP-ribosylglycohydrolase
MTDTSHMLLGALVADAACLGTHWIYDADRIAQIAASHCGQAAFTPVNGDNYADVKGVFVHSARYNGKQTQYGEVLRLVIQSINENGGDFDADDYAAAFAAHFGAGGTYFGYIDRPTKAALDNIAAKKVPTGVDDDQTPAMSRLPAIMARYHGSADLSAMITAAMQVTNVNDVAAAYNTVFASVLADVMDDKPLGQALADAAASADDLINDALLAALSTDETSSTDFAGRTGMMGRACHLPNAGPVMFHILNNSGSYVEAVERNVRAGGDNAGRAGVIGAVMGRVHGLGGSNGMPLDWILQLDDAAEVWDDCRTLAG